MVWGWLWEDVALEDRTELSCAHGASPHCRADGLVEAKRDISTSWKLMSKDILLTSPDNSRIQRQNTGLFPLPLLPWFWTSLRLFSYCCYCWFLMDAFVRQSRVRHPLSPSPTSLSDLTQLGHPFSFLHSLSKIKHPLPGSPLQTHKLQVIHSEIICIYTRWGKESVSPPSV